jgi:hypothetical protein
MGAVWSDSPFGTPASRTGCFRRSNRCWRLGTGRDIAGPAQSGDSDAALRVRDKGGGIVRALLAEPAGEWGGWADHGVGEGKCYARGAASGGGVEDGDGAARRGGRRGRSGICVAEEAGRRAVAAAGSAADRAGRGPARGDCVTGFAALAAACACVARASEGELERVSRAVRGTGTVTPKPLRPEVRRRLPLLLESGRS